MKKLLLICLVAAAVGSLTACQGYSGSINTKPKGETEMTEYYFPPEEADHEGTWLNWPHHYTYGAEYRDEIESIFTEMVKALHTGEKVHIAAYNKQEQNRIEKQLKAEKVDLSRVDFVIAKTDDVWSRDTGPMFVLDEKGTPTIVDFAFDGWGGKTPYENDDDIPKYVSKAKNLPIVDVPDFVLEGGSVELDGSGTAMLCKSSVISKNRNPDMSRQKAEEYLSRYLGVKNFIWLEGALDEDITDAHIDGMARFFDDKTLLTVSEKDFFDMYESIPDSDYETLINAENDKGELYEIIELPMTTKNVKGLDYKGSYLNYYVGNEVVLVPVYGDKNDDKALEILTELYSD